MSGTDTTESHSASDISVAEVAVRVVPDFSRFQEILDFATVTTAPVTAATVTVTTEEEDAERGEQVPWKAILAVEGFATDDNTPAPRYLLPESLSWRDLPLPFMVQTITPAEGGHAGALLSGRIDVIERIPRADFSDADFADVLEDVPEDAFVIFGRGVFDVGPEGEKGAHLVENKMLRGVSVDLVATSWAFADRETLELVEDEEIDLEDVMAERFYRALTSGQIGAATATPVQALGPATIALAAAAEGAGWNTLEPTFVLLPALIAGEGVTAAAPRMVPRSWFELPEPDGLTPLTLTPEGQVFGHPFPWDECHVGISGRCTTAPASPSDYAYFHLGEVETEEGDFIAVGQITLDTGHADLRAGRNATRRHYDDTGVAVADVRVVDGEFGGWMCGALREVPEEDSRKLRAAKLSGDWRNVNGQLELIGLLAVNVPGFPIPRTEARIVASADGEQVCALVAAGLEAEDDLGPMLDDLLELSDAEMLDEICGE